MNRPVIAIATAALLIVYACSSSQSGDTIANALEKETSFSFGGMPLSEVLDIVSQDYVPICIAEEAATAVQSAVVDYENPDAKLGDMLTEVITAHGLRYEIIPNKCVNIRLEAG